MEGLSRTRRTLLEAASLPAHLLLACGLATLLVPSEQPLFGLPCLAAVALLFLHGTAVLVILAPERRRFWLPGFRSLRPLAYLTGTVGVSLVVAGDSTRRPGLFVLYAAWTFLGGAEGVNALLQARAHQVPVGAVGALGCVCGLAGNGLLAFLPEEGGQLGAGLLLAAVLLVATTAAVTAAGRHWEQAENTTTAGQPQHLQPVSMDSELDL